MAEPTTSELDAAGGISERRPRLHPRRVSRRRLAAGAGLLLVAAGVALAVADPFTGSSPSGSGVADNGAATSTWTVRRQDLSQQTQVSATLGYAAPASISVPAGTAPVNVQQAQQAAASAQAPLAAAQATLTEDEHTLARAQATLAGDRRKEAVDCAGANAATSTGASAGGSGGSATPCATDVQAVATDEQALSADSAKVDGDQHAAATAQTALSGAEATLADARASAADYGPTSVYTWLPAAGQVIGRGQRLYAIAGQPTLLLYGSVTPWRAFAAGMSPDADVAALNANLRALGYDAPTGTTFGTATQTAIEALQRAHGATVTGELLLGAVAFEPGAVRVTAVTPTLGAPVQAGKVLDVTSTRRQVSIALDASQQASVKVGDPVTITLPSNATTAGHVSFVGTVATAPSSSGSDQSSTPTIEVDITPDHPAETGRLDQAPVDVSITTATINNTLAVPVNALVALAGGGYAIEEAKPDGTHGLVAVSLGLFDDAQGLVQVSGSGLAVDQRVVVPVS